MKLNKLTFLALVLIFTLNACKKDKSPVIEQEEPKEQVINEWITIDKKGVVNVKDLKVESSRRVYKLFSMDEMKFVEDDKALTSEWDFCFFNTYAQVILANLGTTDNPDAPFFQGAGRVTMAFTGKAFDEVTTVPAAAEFEKAEEMGAWIKINTEVESNQHWAKLIYKENGVASHAMPLKNKTIVLKLTDGRYAKLEYQSFYKGGLLDPVAADYTPDKLGFVNFRYYIAKKGSTDLTTK